MSATTILDYAPGIGVVALLDLYVPLTAASCGTGTAFTATAATVVRRGSEKSFILGRIKGSMNLKCKQRITDNEWGYTCFEKSR